MNGPEERLRQRIENDGPLPFAEFMEEALYGEGGYYATPTPPIGPDGDFVTGASLSPLFGASTARLLERLGNRFGDEADLLEAGYGTGGHLAAVLDALSARSAGSENAAQGSRAHGRRLAWDRIARPVPPGAETVVGLDAVRGEPIRGLVFSYELFDALAFHRLRRTAAGWEELWVGLDHGIFEWIIRPVSSEEATAQLSLYSEVTEEGQILDIAPGWRHLYRRLVDCLEIGLLVTCDYGFDRRRLVDSRIRRHGTLACYRRQTVHRNPFVDIGRQDITAHIDFTTLIEEGEAAGLETLGLVSQAEWLGACGLFEDLEGADQPTRLAAAQLMNLDGMGTEIKVLVQGRGVDPRGLFDLPLSQ